MKQSRESFWVGLFVLIGLAALVALVVLFGRTGTLMGKGEGYVLNIHFDKATGIRPGSLVTVGGIPIGRVRDVAFINLDKFEAGVNVEIGFDEPKYRFHEHTRARTNEPGLGEGRPPIVLLPGPSDGPELASGTVIPGEIGSAMDSLVPPEIVANFDRMRQKLEDAASALTPVLEDMHEILRERHVSEVDMVGGKTGNLFSTVERLDSALKHWNDVLGDPQTKSQLRDSITNFYKMTEDGKAMVSEMKAATGDVRAVVDGAKEVLNNTNNAVTRIDGNVDRVSRLLITVLEITSNTMTHVNALADKAEKGEGTVGQMFGDSRLYESMVLTFRRLAETTEEFRGLVEEWKKGKIRVGL